MSSPLLADGLERHVKHRDHEKAYSAGGDHAGEDRRADGVAAELGRTLRYDQRVHAQNKREGGHHHGAKPHPGAQHRDLRPDDDAGIAIDASGRSLPSLLRM
jgi:hypothetical protein